MQQPHLAHSPPLPSVLWWCWVLRWSPSLRCLLLLRRVCGCAACGVCFGEGMRLSHSQFSAAALHVILPADWIINTCILLLRGGSVCSPTFHHGYIYIYVVVTVICLLLLFRCLSQPRIVDITHVSRCFEAAAYAARLSSLVQIRILVKSQSS